MFGVRTKLLFIRSCAAEEFGEDTKLGDSNLLINFWKAQSFPKVLTPNYFLQHSDTGVQHSAATLQHSAFFLAFVLFLPFPAKAAVDSVMIANAIMDDFKIFFMFVKFIFIRPEF